MLQLRWSAATSSWFVRQRRDTRRPHRRRGANPNCVKHTQLGQAFAKPHFIAIRSVGQHDPGRHAGCNRLAYLRQCNFRLGGKLDPVWHSGLLPTTGIVGPFLGGDKADMQWEGCLAPWQRQADRHLAVVLFVKLAAILACHTHGMFAFLRKARVVNDPITTAWRLQ